MRGTVRDAAGIEAISRLALRRFPSGASDGATNVTRVTAGIPAADSPYSIRREG